MIILGTNSIKETGFNVANSCNFEDGSLHKTVSSPSTTFTISVWVKLSNQYVATSSIGQRYFWTGGGAGGASGAKWNDGNVGILDFYNEGTGHVNDGTGRNYRDPSAWYHWVWKNSGGTGTLYVNGVQNGSTFSMGPLIGSGGPDVINIGRYGADTVYAPMTMAEFVYLDATAATPTSFGEYDDDSGIWKPIDVSGLTFGTNGFHLDFQTAGTLGNDANGGTDLTKTGTLVQHTDTPTNNFATMNPLAYRLDSGVSLPTYSKGNTVVSYANDSGAGKSTMATIGFQNGKWYWEYKVGTANDTIFGGITRMDYDPNDNFAGRSCFYNKSGAFSVGTGTGGTSDGSYGNSYTTNDIIGVAFDCDNGVIWFSKNGTWQNSATISEIGAGTTTNSATTGITLNQFWSPFFEGADGGMSANFGSPAYAISSGNTDGNGYGNFEYAVPSGYYALNTKNLAEYG